MARFVSVPLIGAPTGPALARVAAVDPLHDTRFLWFVNRGSGVIVLALVTASVALGVLATTRTTSSRWPRFVSQALHRNISLLALAFVLAHAGSAIIDSYVDIRWFDAFLPFAGRYHGLWLGLGTLAFDLFVVSAITALLRTRLGLRRWRAVHLSAYAGWLLGLVHGLEIGTDPRQPWSIVITVASVGVVAGAVMVRLTGLAQERRLATPSRPPQLSRR